MALPEKINRYEIKSELGRGGMATVFEAYDPRFQRPVAVKVLPREFMHDPEFQARFTREARTIAALEHPAIVPVYDFGEHDGQPFLVMRLMDGGSLTDRLAEGPIPIDEAADILKRIGSALDRAHGQGIVHRDLKPGNILFDHYGDAFLADFGIARIVSSSSQLTASGSLVGTPSYMSPEQVYGDKELDGRADIYALGVILYQMLTGEIPYEADTPARMMMAHVMNPVPHVADKRPDLADCDEVITKAMAKERDDRYPTASDLSSDLTAVTQKMKRPQVEKPAKTASLVTTMATATPEFAEPETASQPDSAFDEPTYADKLNAPVTSGTKIPVWLWAAIGILAFLCLAGSLGTGFLILGSLSDANDETDIPIGTAVADNDPTPSEPAAVTEDTGSIFDSLDGEDVEVTKEPETLPTDTAVSAEIDAALATRQSLEATREAGTENRNNENDSGASDALATRQSLEATRGADTSLPLDTSFGSLEGLTTLAGPLDGDLFHEPDDDTIEMFYPEATAENFVLNATFINPYAIENGDWDFGVVFRQTTPDDEYRLVVRSDGDWNLNNRLPDEDRFVQDGDVSQLLDLRPDEGNQLTLIVYDDTGYFFLNEQFVDTLDLSERLESGDMALGTGFYTVNEKEGAVTSYESLSVWPFEPVFGPDSGELIHELDDLIKLEETAVNEENMLISATFNNPFAAQENDWDIGFAFRDDDDATKYFLVVASEGDWELVGRYGDADTDTTINDGEIKNLNLAAGQSNTLTLIAWGDVGYFFLNGLFIEELDLSDIQQPGDVEILTAFYFDHEIEGESTDYEAFTVWPLP